MNATQKKKIAKKGTDLRAALASLSPLTDPREILRDATGKVDEAKQEIESIRDDVEEKYESLSEKAQEGDKGQELSQSKDTLDDIIGDLDTVVSDLQDENINDLSVEEFGEKIKEVTEALETAADKIDELE